MKQLFFIFISLIFLGSCNVFNKYPGFSKTKTGIYFKLHKIGEEVAPPIPSNFVTIAVKYTTIRDSAFFSGTRTFQLTNPDFKGSIDECFLMLSAGDSASFIIDATNFFTKTLQTKLPRFINKGEDIKIELRLDEIRTAEQYQKDKEDFLKWIEDFGEYEKTVLGRFIQNEKIDVDPMENGMYFITLLEGTGKPVEAGDLVTVNYEGRFLNGKFFDSTNKRNQPFEFVYGSEMQVIGGIEEAIGRMREGERALIILPSELAWGEKGSSTGIIPPFTSVIYEVELIKTVPREFEE
ncbi:MAG: FKBP-type peptidyl-prolyl cis-trans isomerase [Salinivirgaceae bacterium]|jgi:FKBP-type peptidyl-prolyl cis-trans isomerase FkpA|nr:FKBP-type peptidyl-prolyl cis-trans isomerase [Salinivirgaceae bacterium]